MESNPLPFGTQQMPQIDPNQFTAENYIQLVRQLHQASSTQFDQAALKQADTLLQQFSKTHQAWSITMQVLTTPGLDQKDYFNAANILKNKMIHDFASLRQQDFNVSFQMRDNLIMIIKRMALEENSRPQLQSLCTALAILVIHINESWPSFVQDITQELSGSVDHAICLLLILKYMASDCDNDSIVIEDSIRQNFYHFMDKIASQIFGGVFNLWAQKILESGYQNFKQPPAGQASTQQELEAFKMQRLRSKLIEAIYFWLKITFPDELFQTLTTNYPALIQLVFTELEHSKDENLENATSCVIELISLSRKKEKFSSIKDTVIKNVEHLITRVDMVVAQKDEELGEQLMDIFIELGLSHLEQIVETGTLTIPQILLKLMQIPEIQSRRTVTFWRKLFKDIGKTQVEEVKRSKLQTFEPVLLALLDQIIMQIKPDDYIFEEFSFAGENEDAFDDIMRIRDDFALLNHKISEVCGASSILQFYLGRLQQAIQSAQQKPDVISNWATIESIYVCIIDTCEFLKVSDLAMLKDVVMLTFQLPSKYGALRRIGCLFLSSVSFIMKDLGDSVQADIKSFLDFVLPVLENKYLVIPAARAFKNICTDHAKTLQPFAIEILDKVLPMDSGSKWNMNREYELMLEAFASLVKQCEDNQACEALLKRIILPLIVPLNKKIEMLKAMNAKEGRKLKKGEINQGTLDSVHSYLYLIGNFLKECQTLSLRQTNPYVSLFQEIWVFIGDLISEFLNLDEVVEYSVRIMKTSLRILGRHFDPYLIKFLQMVVASYQQNHLPSFIYAVEFCLQDYSQNREYEPIFQEAFNHITFHTVTNILIDFKEFEYNPEVAFDFFGLCSRLIKTNKKLFFNSPNLESLLNTWVIGIGTEHPDTVKTHKAIFAALLTVLHADLSQVAPLEQENLNFDDVSKVIKDSFPDICVNEVATWRYLLENGQHIVNKLIEFMLSAPSGDVVDYTIDILVVICKYIPSKYKQQWFISAFQRIPNNILTQEEKENHLGYLMASHKKDDGLIDNFSIIYRRAKNVVGRGH